MNQRKVGVALSYISEAIKIITHLVYTPIMLRILGQSEYGLYQLVNSVVGYLSLFHLGFAASYVKFYSAYKIKDDENSIYRLNGMYLTVFLVISVLVIFSGTIMVSNIETIFYNGLTETEYSKATVLMIIMICSMVLTFPNSVFSCIITAHERFFFHRLVHVLSSIIHPFLALPLLLLGYGSVGLVALSFFLTLSHFIINVWYVFKKIKTKFLFNHFQFTLFKEIWLFTFFIFLNQIIDQVNWNVDKFLLGRMAGTAAVAVYGLGAHINTMYIALSTSISSVFVPQIHALLSGKKHQSQISELFVKIGRIQFIVLSLVLSGYILFGKNFMIFWGGSEYEDSYYVALILISAVTIPLIQNIGIEVQRAMNKHQARSIVYFFIAIGNIAISIPMIGKYGVFGAALGTAISLFAGNIMFMNWYYQKKINIDIRLFWKEILSFWRAFVLPLLFGGLIMKIYIIRHLYELLAIICAYTVVFCFSMWRFGMNENEKDMINKMIHRKKAA